MCCLCPLVAFIHEQRDAPLEGVQHISEPSVTDYFETTVGFFPGRRASLPCLYHTPHTMSCMHVDNAPFGLIGVCIFWCPVSGEPICRDSTMIDGAECRSAGTRFASPFWKDHL